ncbi:regulatory signaling modulator protein AmpE, partial [Escherichia coli]|uniref:regulatory signaling modulator protein AmpE n=1 Tax=Escherichia coli TaxID=562 RepID=UPI0010CC346C
RLHYHAYLTAASRNDSHAHATMAGELTMNHGVPAGSEEGEYLRERENEVLRMNFRFYVSCALCVFWGATVGPCLPCGVVLIDGDTHLLWVVHARACLGGAGGGGGGG